MPFKPLASLAAALALAATPPAHAVGQLIDVQVVDRTTGETLTPVRHDGEWWIAGRPGSRYGVRLTNRNGQRTLNVVAVDGINAISGDTAAWSQTGYVLAPYRNTEIDGWRKNVDQVAAFEFTALPDSYAARTGRPADVGVIGIAVFNELRRPPTILRRDAEPIAEGRATPRAAPAPSVAAADEARSPSPPSSDSGTPGRSSSPLRSLSREKIGTGHGAIEESAIRYVAFRRARATPDEIVTIHYDRRENLIAMGILPSPSVPPLAVDPFPGSGRFVADPPPR